MSYDFKKAFGKVPGGLQGKLKDFIVVKTGWSSATWNRKVNNRTPLSNLEFMFIYELLQNYNINLKTGNFVIEHPENKLIQKELR